MKCKRLVSLFIAGSILISFPALAEEDEKLYTNIQDLLDSDRQLLEERFLDESSKLVLNEVVCWLRQFNMLLDKRYHVVIHQNMTGDVSFPLPLALHKVLGGEYLVVRNDHHETDYTPEGRSLLQTMVYCDEETARRYIALRSTDRKAYLKEKRRMARITKKVLEAKFPDLKGTLELLDVWTPATYKRYLGTEMGSFMSFALPKRRFPIKKSNRIPGVSNVILAGQWLQMPGGLPIAAKTGRDAANILEELGLSGTEES